MTPNSGVVDGLQNTDASRVAASTMEMIQRIHEIDQESDMICLQSFERRIAFLEDVQKALQVEKSKQRRQRNAFAPFFRLPVELLVNIIQEAYEEIIYPIAYYRRLLQLSSISHSWHQIIFGNPPLWNHVGMDMPTSAILQVVGNSGVVPLRVYLYCSSYGRKTLLKDFLEMVLPFQNRWSYLSVGNVSQEDMPIVHPLWSEAMPLLHSLRVSNDYYYRGSITKDPAACDPFNNTVSLREVYLKNATISASAKILGGLRSLHLDTVKLIEDDGDNSPLLEIVGQCPDLEFLHIEYVRDAAENALRTSKPSTAVELRKLRSLILCRNDAVGDHLVENIIAPRCTVLRGTVAPGPGLERLCEWVRQPSEEGIKIQLDITSDKAWLTAKEGDRSLDVCIGDPHTAANWHWLETFVDDLPDTSILSVFVTHIDLDNHVEDHRFCDKLLAFQRLEELQIADCGGMQSLYQLMGKPVEDEMGLRWAFPSLRSWAISFRNRMDDVGFLPMLRTRYVTKPKVSRGKAQSPPPELRTLDRLHIWRGRKDTLPKIRNLLPDVDIRTGMDADLFSRRFY